MKVFHTVHGYLFHDNRNPKKWAYLLPEKLCGLLTDVLMVMNHEDLEIAKKYRLCKDSCRIFYIDGMGIDLSRFSPGHASSEQRKSFGINENDFTFLYAAEFSVRKNHELLIRGFAEALKKLNELKMNGVLPAGLPVDRLKLVLAGDGALFNKMNALTAELKISDKIIFLGHMKNMNELYPCCDAAVTTSRIEELPFNVMEAMACGLPVIASDIKGHRELIVHGKNGLLFKDGEQHHLADYLIEIYKNTALREDFSHRAVRDTFTYRDFSHDLDLLLDDVLRDEPANSLSLGLYAVAEAFLEDCYFEKGALEPLVKIYSTHRYQLASTFERLLEQLVEAERGDLVDSSDLGNSSCSTSEGSHGPSPGAYWYPPSPLSWNTECTASSCSYGTTPTSVHSFTLVANFFIPATPRIEIELLRCNTVTEAF
jgi:hypothetical protein